MSQGKVTASLAKSRDPEMALLRGAEVTDYSQDLYALVSQAVRQYSNRTDLVSLYQSKGLLLSVTNSYQAGGRRELRWTYAQLFDGANCLVASLYSQSLRPGDSIAVFPENNFFRVRLAALGREAEGSVRPTRFSEPFPRERGRISPLCPPASRRCGSK